MTREKFQVQPRRLPGVSTSPCPQIAGRAAAKDARTKYRSAKALRQLAEQQPELLYPHFDFFAGLLAHENKIFQWQGIIASILSDVLKSFTIW